jgi:hypothetical protein
MQTLVLGAVEIGDKPNPNGSLLSQEQAEQIASDLMATKAVIDAKAVAIGTHWVVLYQDLENKRSNIYLLDSPWHWDNMRTPAQKIKIGNISYGFNYAPSRKEVNVMESIPYIDQGNRPPHRRRFMPAATMPTTEEVAAWIPTAFSPPVQSNTFADYAAHYCPVKKHAWLYVIQNRHYRIVADKDMEQTPTPQQVTNWVVDFLNGRLNEELAKLIATAA